MSYKIPLFDLNYGKEEEEAVVNTLRSKWISSGPKTAEFESRFASMLNIKHAVALSNCTVALHLALKVLEVGEGDEVICPSLTFVATVNAIKYQQAIPRFCDITRIENPAIDPSGIRKLITPKTKAIIVMHYGGFACEMDEILAIAKEHNLKVIEDACHGPYGEYHGKKLGTMGDIGCFSFFSNKNISTGEGGMLVTNNDAHATRVKLLRSHGMTTLSYERAQGHATAYEVVELGYNYRLDDIRATLGLCQLDKLPEDLMLRAKIRERYLEKLSGIDSIIIPFKDYQDFTTNYVFPIVLKDSTFDKREQVRRELTDMGIQTSVHYPSVHKFSFYLNPTISLPFTEYFSENEITFPMYGKLTNGEVDYISDSIRQILL